MTFGSFSVQGGAARRLHPGRRVRLIPAAALLFIAVTGAACGSGTVDRGIDVAALDLDSSTTVPARQKVPVTTSESAPDKTTSSNAAPSSQPRAFEPASFTVLRGQPAELVLDTGASLTIPPGSITSPDALVGLRQVGPATYEPTIDGTWKPPVRITLPVGATTASSWTFFLHQARSGWAVDRAALEPTTTISHDLQELTTVRALSCGDPRSPDTHVLLCLTSADVTNIPVEVAAQLAAGLGCADTWPINNLLFQTDYCTNIGSTVATDPQSPQTLRPVPGGGVPTTILPGLGGSMSVTLSEDPFACNSASRIFGTLSGALPGEGLTFSSPQAAGLRPGVADANGNKGLRWFCDPSSAGTTWSLTALGQTSGRTVTFTFTGAAPDGSTTTAAPVPPPPTPPAPPAQASAVIYENPFLCNGVLRSFGTVVGLVPGETVRITSPTIGALKPGTVDVNGNLSLNWRCETSAKGSVWQLTATGNSSGRSVTFSFSGY